MGERSWFLGSVRVAVSSGCAIGLAILVACGGGGGGDKPATTTATTTTTPPVPTALPSIASFDVTPGETWKGQSVTLKAVFSDGVGTVDHGVGTVTSGSAVTISPDADTSYLLTVKNAAGQQVTKNVVVKVNVVPDAVLSSKKPLVSSGQVIQLIPDFPLGTGTLKDFGVVTSGQVVEVPAPVVSSPTTLLFTLNVDLGAGGTSVATTQVSVVPGPKIERFDVTAVTAGLNGAPAARVVSAASAAATVASPIEVTATATILYGGRAVVTPVFADGKGSIAGIGDVVSGQTYQVSPLLDQTYTLRVVNDAGEVTTADAKVQVIQPSMSQVTPQTSTLSTGKTLAFGGATVAGAVDATIKWSASAGTIDGKGLFTAPTTPGAVTVTATSNAKASVSQIATVAVVGIPTIVGGAQGLVADVPAPAYGQTVNISAVFSGGKGVLTDPQGQSLAVTSPVNYASAPVVAPVQYQLAVTNEAGEVVKAVLQLSPQAVGIAPVTPAVSTVSVGDGLKFGTTVSGAADQGISWTATAGVMASDGSWIAPQVAGNVTITAASKADASKKSTATVKVVDLPVVSDFSPTPGIVLFGGSANVTATFVGTGTIQGMGLVVSGQPFSTGALTLQKTYILTVANEAGKTVQKTLTVDVQPVSVGAIQPPITEKLVGTTASFSSSVVGAVASDVTWSATAGTMSPLGVWTAPAVPGVVTVTAASAADPRRTASLLINVLAAPQVASFVASPARVPYGGTAALTATFQNGQGVVDGGVGPVVSGVSVPTPTVVGPVTFGLTVTNSVANAKATATVEVENVVADILPTSATVTVGGSVAFTGSVTGAADATMNWSATGGPVTSAGQFSAPMVPGTYQVTVGSRVKADAQAVATVTVVAAPVASGLVAGVNPVPFGGTTTLTPSYSNGQGVVDQGVGSVTSGSVYPSAALKVSTVYTLTVTNAAGTQATKTLSIGVQPVAVTPVLPVNLVLTVGKTTTFTASVSGAVDAAVLWSATGGQIDGTGRYTAPNVSGIYTIKATSAADGTASQSVTVKVVDLPSIASFVASPSSVVYGGVTTLTASFQGGTGSVDGGVGAVVSGQGVQTGALTASGSWTLTVTNEAGDLITKTSSATVQVPSISAVTPAAPVLTVGETKQFLATVSGAQDASVVWTVTGGSITAGGFYTAPGVAGTYTVTATSHAKGDVLSTTTVKVVAAPAIATFTAGKMSLLYGESTLLTIVYSGGQGSMDHGIGNVPSGAPYSTGSLTQAADYTLTVTNEAGAQATAAVHLTVSSVSISAVSPATAIKTVNATQKFGATVTGALNPAITWTATAGSVAPDGTFTAPAMAQTVTVTAASTADLSKASTAVVTVVGAPTASISASTTTPLYGATVVVTPVFTNQASASVGTAQNSNDISNAPTSGSGITSAAMTVAKTFWLRATNAAGDFVDASVLVTPQPVVVSAVSPAGAYLTVGHSQAFSASVTQAQDATIAWSAAGPGGAGAWVGTTWTAPMTPGDYTITAKANADGVTLQTAVVHVVAAPTASITASTTSPLYGATVVVTPVFTNQASASVGTAQNSNDISNAPTSGSGITSAAMTVAKTYYLRATNAAGDSVDASVLVTPQPVVVSAVSPTGAYLTVGHSQAFSASVTQAQDTIIAWSAAGPGGAGAWVGTTWTAPMTPGDYTITAKANADGVTLQTAVVHVVAAPTASIVTSNANPLYGATTVTVTPTFANQTSASVGTSLGGSDIANAPTSGSAIGVQGGGFTVVKTYYLRATNAAGDSVDASVLVTPQPVVVSAVSPAGAYLTVGHSQAFSATVTQAVDTTIAWTAAGPGGAGAWVGTTWTAPMTPGDYTITAKANADGVTLQTATIHVVAAPTASIVSSTTSPLYGATVVLTPTFANQTSAAVGTSLGGNDLSNAPTSGTGINSAVMTVAKTYYLRATNAAGDSVDASVLVTPQPVVLSAVSPAGAYLTVGHSQAFSATVTQAVDTTIAWTAAGPGGAGAWVGTTWTAPMTPGDYTITAKANADGVTLQTAVVHVVAAPVINSLTPSVNPVLYGDTTDLVPDFQFGTGVIDNGMGAVASGQSYGTAALTAATTYRLTVTNQAGDSVHQDLSVTIQAVAISAVLPDGVTTTPGGAMTFGATVSGAKNPAVQWSASAGTMDATTGIWVAPAAPGAYTITGAVQAKPAVNATATIQVVAAPAISAFTATPAVVDYDGTSVLNATFTNATAGVDHAVGAVTSGVDVTSPSMKADTTYRVLATSNATYDNLLPNADAERVVGGAVQDAVNAHGGTGVFSLLLVSGANEQVLLSPVPASAGQGYAVSGWGKASAALTGAAKLQVRFLDGGMALKGSQDVVLGSDVAFGGSAASGMAYAPAGTTQVELVWMVTADPADAGKTAFLDDAVLRFVDWKDVSIAVRPVVVSAVTPDGITRTAGTTTAFAATVSQAVDTTINWTANGGSVDGSGQWTAPGVPGLYTITATSAANPAVSTSATVTVVAAPAASISASTTTPLYGASVQVTPVYANAVSVAVGLSQGGSELSAAPVSGVAIPAGAVTAPVTYWIRAFNAAGDFVDANSGVVTPQVVVVNAVTPAGVTRTVGTVTSFSSSVLHAQDATIQWSASAGSMNSVTGQWTAPGSAQVVTITATSVGDPSTFATTTVTVVAAPSIGSFAPAKATVTSGTGTTLTGVFSNGNGSVDNGLGAVASGTPKATGNLASTTTYTLTVLNAAGDSVTAQTTVTVVPPVTISSFVAAASPIAYGASTTITPTFTGATSASVDQGIGAVVSGTPYGTGALTASRTYTLTALNAAGDSYPQSVTVTVQPPVVSAVTGGGGYVSAGYTAAFSATVTQASDTSITWSATGPGGAGAWAGSTWTAPATAGVYTIKATANADGLTNQTTTITVVSLPAASSLNASTTSPLYGAAVTLTPTFSNGTGSVDQGIGAVTSGNGYGTAVLTAPKTYTLTVTNQAGQTATASVTVTPQTVVVGAVTPAGTTKTVSTNTAFSATPTGGALNTVTWSSTAGSWAGNTWTAPATAQTVTITATSVDDVSKTSTTTVTVVAAPVATSLTASTLTPAYGSTFTLTPVYSSGTGSIDNGVTCPATGVASGALTANWSGARTYTLTVTNTAGGTATTSVTVTPQTVVVGAVTPAGTTKTVSTSTAFSATPTGGVLNTVTWSSTAGSWAGNTWTAPATAQTVTITATSVDDPSKTSTTTVTVVAMPVATSLTASTLTPAYGSTFTLTPAYSSGTGSIDNGVTCPATGVASGALTANWSGARTYTLTVSNTAGATATTSVTVTPQTVSLGAVTPAGTTKTVSTSTAFSCTPTGGALNTVTWSSTAGSWAGNTWTAPATAQVVTITATSVDDVTKTRTTTVTVVAAATSSISATTTSPLYKSTTVSVTPTFTGGTATLGTTAGGSDISASPTSGNAIGVQGSGFITAKTYYLRVTNAAGDYVDSSVVVTPQTVSLTGMTPLNPTKTVNSSTGFSVSITGSVSGTVNWSSTGGSWFSNIWTAPAAPGTYTVTATSGDDPSKTATSTVTVVAAPVATSVVATKGTISVGSSTTVTPTFSNGTGKIGVSGSGSTEITASATSGVGVSTGAQASTKTVTLTVTNAANDSVTATCLLTVVALPTSSISASNQSPAFASTSVFVNPVFTGAASAMVGTSQGGNDISSSPSSGTSIPVQVSGFTVTKTYWLRATNAAGDYLDSSVTITPTTVSLGSVTPATKTMTVSTTQAFSVSSAGGTTNNLNWSSTGGSFSPVTTASNGNSTWTASATPGTYTITATSVDDPTKTATATATVVAAPVATSLVATKATVTTGSATTVTPTFTGGAGGVAKIGTGGAGTSDLTAAATTGSGVSTGALVSTKTYTLTVTNAAGAQATTACTVTVVAAATASISPSTASPLYGATNVTVTPTFSGGTAVVGTSQGASNISASATSGSPIAVQGGGFTATTTYWVRATNTAGDYVDSSTTITPQTASVSAISNGGGYVSVGYTRSLSATTSGVSNGNINWTATGGSFSPATTASGGSTTWTAPGGAGTYTLYATSAGDGSKQTNTSIQVVGLPTVSVSVGSSAITAGNSTGLNWSSTNASSVNITNYSNGLGASGGVSVTPGSTTTYTGTAYNLAGQSSSTSSATVNVYGAPSVSSFTASPSSISSGASSTLYPVFSAPGGSASIDQGIGAVSSGGGYGTGALAVSKTYTLTVSNGAGAQATATATVTVNTAMPIVTSHTMLAYGLAVYDDCSNYLGYYYSSNLEIFGTWDSVSVYFWHNNAWVIYYTDNNHYVAANYTLDAGSPWGAGDFYPSSACIMDAGYYTGDYRNYGNYRIDVTIGSNTLSYYGTGQ